MPFEQGKKYEFLKNEFDISKESGRLYFIIKDPVTDLTYRIKPFDFQSRHLPDKIVCFVNSNGRLLQDVYSVPPLLYVPGEEYSFRVMKQDYKTLRCTIRDDVNGVEYANIDLGKKRVERFQRIVCRVLSVDNGKFSVQLADNESRQSDGFSLNDLGSLPEAAPFLRGGVIGRLMDSEVFVDAKIMMGQGDPRWLVTALDTVTKYLPQWLENDSASKRRTIMRLKALTIGLIERSTFLSRIPLEERRQSQERLTAVIHSINDYLRATELITCGGDELMIKATLNSLKTSGWLYEPEKKMRLLMAIFSLRNAYAHAYIGEIFAIIRDHHADSHFMDTFRQGFITMLSIYINNESKVLDPLDRDALRELIMALALELLLTGDTEYELWNVHRGLLYTCASLLVNRYDSILPAKALQCYADRIDAPLEFSWRDLDDISILCYNRLCARLPYSSAATADISVFEEQNARISVNGSHIVMAPSVPSPNMRAVLNRELFPGMNLEVRLDSRLTEGSTNADASPTLQLPMWKQLERMLFDPAQHLNDHRTATAALTLKTPPEVGDEVVIRITGKDEYDFHTYFCTIEDPAHEGRGTILTHDMVGYPVKGNVQTFEQDGKPLLFNAVVTARQPDGQYVFSMRPGINRYCTRLANDDMEAGCEIPAIITADDAPNKYFAVSESGYSFTIWKRRDQPELHKYDCVYATIEKVNTMNNNLFVQGQFVRMADDAEDIEDRDAYLNETFRLMLQEYADHQVYEPEYEPSAQETPEDESSLSVNYLSPMAVSAISQLLNVMAISEGEDLPRAYMLLSVSLIMAHMAGDMYRATFLQAKRCLIEALAKFAADGRIDPAEADNLNRQCSRFANDDADLRQKLGIVMTLSRLDQPGELGHPAPTDMSPAAKTIRLVSAYNQLRGLRMNPVRAEILKGIYALLRLPVPAEVDVIRIKAKEDQHNEFKESMIYPAGNGMHAYESRQGREIMEVIDGMLNSEGGTLYLGVNNLGIPRGLDNDFKYLNRGNADYDLLDMEDKFSLAFYVNLRDHIGLTYNGYPLRDFISLEFDELDGKIIARVNVRQFPGMVRMKDEKVFLRQESSTIPLRTAKEIKDFEKKRLALSTSEA